jgi:dienelactone hydrolase
MRALSVLLLAAVPALADVKSKLVEYDAAGTACKGMLYFPSNAKGPLPVVIVFHEWWGLNDYARKRAEMLAKEGYVAFCADMYGDGKTADHPDDAKKFMSAVAEKQDNWLARAQAALKAVKAQDGVDPERIHAMGYCFGGATALVLGLNSPEIKTVTMFHAGFPNVTAEQASKFKARLLVCHGGADVFIPAAKIEAFRKVLDEAKVNYEFVSYPGATHSFTVEGVEKKMPMLKYDADADQKSWAAMLAVLKSPSK